MTKEEIDFINSMIDKLQQKDKQILKLTQDKSVLVKNTIRDNWVKRYNNIHETVSTIKQECEKGFLTDKAKQILEQHK